MHELETDVAVLGSGASGCVLGCAAAEAGHDVLFIERGGYVRGLDMSHDEVEMMARLYKDGGLQLSSALDLYLIQGCCVGGGTVISNGVLFRMPEAVHARWRDVHGFPIARAPLSEAYARVESRSGAAPVDQGCLAPSHAKFHAGARVLGLKAEHFMKAVHDCLGCGACNIGCPYDKKRTPQLTYFPDALAAGARVMPFSNVDRLERDRHSGRVRAAIVTRRVGERVERLRVVAETFVLAAGAIDSSGLLLKSRLTNRHVGRRLALNLGTPVFGRFSETLDAFDGDNMGAFIRGDGFTIEVMHNPPGTQALLTPGWFSEHARRMRAYRQIAGCGAIIGTASSGRVKWSRLEQCEVVHFPVSRADLARLRDALILCAKLLLAAGAVEVFLPIVAAPAAHTPEQAESLLRAGLKRTWDFNSLGSAHIQGGNAVSPGLRRGAVNERFRVLGIDNLVCADASVFPSALGVNPMLTVLAISDHVAREHLGWHTGKPVAGAPQTARDIRGGLPVAAGVSSPQPLA